MLRVVLELPWLLLELPYELLEEEELPPRCCDWPNTARPEIASATLSRHAAANTSLCIVESCSTSPAMPASVWSQPGRSAAMHSDPEPIQPGSNSQYWKTDLHLPPRLGVTCAGNAVDV